MQINFVNVKEGRLITRLLAEFDVKPVAGKPTTIVYVMELVSLSCKSIEMHVFLCMRAVFSVSNAVQIRMRNSNKQANIPTCWEESRRTIGAAGIDGEAETTDVLLDAQIKAKQLPPPPFKGMVKGTVSAATQLAVLLEL